MPAQMILSPLQLSNYFVTEISLTANSKYDAEKPELRAADLTVTPTFTCIDNATRRSWSVMLRVQHQAPPEINAPYSFVIVLVGFFQVNAILPIDQIESVVKTNATSILYSTIREIVRNLTAQGPFLRVLLPAPSFLNAVDGTAKNASLGVKESQ